MTLRECVLMPIDSATHIENCNAAKQVRWGKLARRNLRKSNERETLGGPRFERAGAKYPATRSSPISARSRTASSIAPGDVSSTIR